MNTNNFIRLLEGSGLSSSVSHRELELVIESFPFFQSARMLYLKSLKLENNFLFNSTLKTTAAYVSDRTVLFEYISKEENIKVDDVPVEKRKKYIEPKKIKSDRKEYIKREYIKFEKPQNQSVLTFSKNDKHSFDEWLKLSNISEIKRKESNIKSKIKSNINSDLIDKFISSNPRLRPIPKDEEVPKNIHISGDKENTEWMTETLAKVFVEQKKYSKAINVYKVLGLKYPEKSSIFAEKIRALGLLSEK